MYRRLEATQIVETAARLRRRIEERFPESGLTKVASELEEVAREAATLSSWLARPDRPLRIAVGVAVALLVAALGVLLAQLRFDRAGGWYDTFQGVEALVNDLVFTSVAIYFLVGLEVRKKRRRALAALHVLRSFAHIVDMHQLTKDPEQLSERWIETASSPERTLTPFELGRYLDYSSELLAIVSKVAALYVQESNDAVTVDAASAVEELAISLSRTIWQKIMILNRTSDFQAPHAGPLA
jgi:hypothetical protein